MATGIALALMLAACGESARPAPLTFSAPQEDSQTASSSGAAVDAGPPKCGVPTPEVCDCAQMDIAGEPPNIYFVLDHSGSMQRDDLWTTVSGVVLDTVRKIGNRARYGAALFPAPSSADSCAPGVEIMSTRQGDPAGSYGPVWNYLHDRTILIPPSGGTPTSATLEALRPTLTALPGKTFVVLATDGGPNCNLAASCGTDRCMLNIEQVNGCSTSGPNCCAPPASSANCVDTSASEASVRALKAAGIPSYIIGVPGSATYAALLDSLATLGGTEQTGATKYFRVDSTKNADFSKVLAQVVAKIVANCTISLNRPPSDPQKLNVYLDETITPQDGESGWTLEGQTVTLKGESCSRVLSGEVLDVRVIAGCKTYNPR
jgi:hypothetical protein